MLGRREARWPHRAWIPGVTARGGTRAQGHRDSVLPPQRCGAGGRALNGLGGTQTPLPRTQPPPRPSGTAGTERREDEPRGKGQPVPAVPSPEGARSRSLGAAARTEPRCWFRCRCRSLPGVPGPSGAPPTRPRPHRARTYPRPSEPALRRRRGWQGMGGIGKGWEGPGEDRGRCRARPEAVPGWRCGSEPGVAAGVPHIPAPSSALLRAAPRPGVTPASQG